MFKITFKLNRSQQILILMFEGQGRKNSHAVGLEVFIHHETLVKMKKKTQTFYYCQYIMSGPLEGHPIGHYIMFCPLEGHPSGHFIVLYLQ